eukprot:165340_1
MALRDLPYTHLYHLHQPSTKLLCLILLITAFPMSCSATGAPAGDPKVVALNNTIYRLKVRLIVFYVFTGLLVLIIILMIRIARTYKLSLISAESKLQTLLIHSDHVLNQSQLPLYHYSSPRYRQNSQQTEATVKSHHSEPIISANILREAQQETKESIFLKPPSPTRDESGSIWRKIGDYIIHVKANGDVESHNLNPNSNNILNHNTIQTRNDNNTHDHDTTIQNGITVHRLRRDSDSLLRREFKLANPG